jgi:Papain fold toxin 1, glutamine deamidase
MTNKELKPGKHARWSGRPSGTVSGRRWKDLAQSTEQVQEPAIHATSVPNAIASKFIKREYPQLNKLNATRYYKKKFGYTQNCSNNVIAVNQMLDGIKVSTASRYVPEWPDIAALGNPQVDWAQVPDYDTIIRDISTRGEGARGIVYISRPGNDEGDTGSGHVFNVFHDKNGVVFVDGQIGQLAWLEPDVDFIEYLPYR